MNKRFFTPEPRIFAHRGDSLNFPENTLPSFRSAVDMGVDVIETDVHRTRDGHFVVLHDDHMSRVTDGAGRARDLTLEEIRRMDAGYRFTPDGKNFPFRGKGVTISTLEEVLAAFPQQRFNVDLKDNNPAQAGDYCALIRGQNAEGRVLTASEFSGNLKAVRKLLPEMATSASRWEIMGVYFLFRSGLLVAKKKIAADALQIPEFFGTSHVASPGFIRALHRLGVKVHVWTVNKEVDMKRLLDAGADAIMSDNPALLKKVISEHEPPRG